METCPVSTTLQLIGGKYKTLIIWHLLDNTYRFMQLQKKLNISAKVLSQQLKELENDQIVIRTAYLVIPPQVEYKLSTKGMSLRPLLNLMYEWGEKHLLDSGITPNCFMNQ